MAKMPPVLTLPPIRTAVWILAAGLLAFTGCKPDSTAACKTPPGTTAYEIDIPPFFPPMDIPPDNPMTVAGVELGRLLV